MDSSHVHISDPPRHDVVRPAGLVARLRALLPLWRSDDAAANEVDPASLVAWKEDARLSRRADAKIAERPPLPDY